jgi:hypothetical protein
VLPALDYCLKCSHLFNVLDSSGSIGVTERTSYILRVRQLAVGDRAGLGADSRRGRSQPWIVSCSSKSASKRCRRPWLPA